jgi:hypothetical protein
MSAFAGIYSSSITSSTKPDFVTSHFDVLRNVLIPFWPPRKVEVWLNLLGNLAVSANSDTIEVRGRTKHSRENKSGQSGYGTEPDDTLRLLGRRRDSSITRAVGAVSGFVRSIGRPRAHNDSRRLQRSNTHRPGRSSGSFSGSARH